MAWPIVTEGIEIGDEMPQLAVGMNQGLRFNAGPSFRRADLLGSPEGPGQALRPAAGRSKTREKCLPVWVYRTRVRLVLFIQPVDVVRIRTIDDVKRFHK